MDRFFDNFSRALASATSRRDMVRLTFGALFGGATASACVNANPTTPRCSGKVVCGDGCCDAGTTCCNGGCCPSGTTCVNGLCHSGGGGSNQTQCLCTPGNTWNYLTGICCPNTAPYYYPGTHGGTRGCYASCPYIGDCGSQWQRC